MAIDRYVSIRLLLCEVIPRGQGRMAVQCPDARLVVPHGKIIVNFIDFHIKCSNEDIFVLHLANLGFRGYVRSGRWVGEVSQTRYAENLAE